MLSKEEVLRVIAHCKDNGLTYKDGCVQLGVCLWRFNEAKARYKREEADGNGVGEFLQIRADGPMEPANITAMEGPARQKKDRGAKVGATSQLQVEIVGRGGSVILTKSVKIGLTLDHRELTNNLQDSIIYC